MLESCEKLNNQAILYAQRGDFTEAIACFKRAITMEHENYLLWYNLGLTYRDYGDLDNAKRAVEHAHNLNPYDEEIIETLAVICFNLEQYEEAIGYCMYGLNINNWNSHLLNTLGVVYFNKSDFEAAEEVFELAVSLNPYYEDALYNLRDTYEELNNKAGYQECQRILDSLSDK